MRVYFVLISEGHSDEGLLSHLENLCIEAGADEVTGTVPDFRRLPELIGRTVEEKLRATLRLEPGANLILIHRDADSRNAEPRYQEISRAVDQCNLAKQWAAIVPVQETEAGYCWMKLRFEESLVSQILAMRYIYLRHIMWKTSPNRRNAYKERLLMPPS